MKNIRKPLFLILMLVVPGVIFLSMRTFGENHFKLPRYIPEIDSVTGKIKKQGVSFKGRTIQDTVFHTLSDFTLTDQNGKAVNKSLITGKIHIADFIFTRCPGQCPMMSKEMVRVQEVFEKEKSLVILSYTVDPEHDTPEVLKNYAENLGAIPGKWYFLTGDKKEIYRMALKQYFVTAKEEKTNSSQLEDKFVHTDKMILIDTEGQIRGFYNGTDNAEVDKLILETKVLLHEIN
jgi:protein SCO1